MTALTEEREAPDYREALASMRIPNIGDYEMHRSEAEFRYALVKMLSEKGLNGADILTEAAKLERFIQGDSKPGSELPDIRLITRDDLIEIELRKRNPAYLDAGYVRAVIAAEMGLSDE